MKQHIPEEFSTRSVDLSPFAIMDSTLPPRDPDEDEEDEERTAPTSPAGRAQTGRRLNWHGVSQPALSCFP